MTKRDANAVAVRSSGRFAYDGLERSIHEKARLGIMTSLLTQPSGVSFNDLKSLCDLTDGNLNRHLEVLLEDGLIAVEKEQSSRRSKTVCRLTPLGRKRFLEYLDELQRVVADAAEAAAPSVQTPQLRWSTGS
jgi:DNA-binding HxlR family transcriptional regulator